MKYTGKYFLLAVMFVAVAGLSLRAQVNYLAPSNALVSPPPEETSGAINRTRPSSQSPAGSTAK